MLIFIKLIPQIFYIYIMFLYSLYDFIFSHELNEKKKIKQEVLKSIQNRTAFIDEENKIIIGNYFNKPVKNVWKKHS